MTPYKFIPRILIVAATSLMYPLPVTGQTWFTNGQSADLMLSGAGSNNTGGALLFNHPSGIASDGTRFLLCDRFNNVLRVGASVVARKMLLTK